MESTGCFEGSFCVVVFLFGGWVFGCDTSLQWSRHLTDVALSQDFENFSLRFQCGVSCWPRFCMGRGKLSVL